MRKNYDGKQTLWLDGFFKFFRDGACRANKRLPRKELGCFGLVGVAVLQEILHPDWRTGSYGGKQIASCLLADNLGVSVKTVRLILRNLAQAGLIIGITEYDRVAKRQRPLEIIVNPVFVKQTKTANVSTKRQLAEVFADRWLARREPETATQGFGDEDVAWGSCPPGIQRRTDEEAEQAVEAAAAAARSDFMAKLEEAQAGFRVSPEKLKARENARRREQDKLFIAGSSRVWVNLQVRNGNADAEANPPAWATAVHTDAPPAARPDRHNLLKCFHVYGGLKAAVAWAVYNGASPAIDGKTGRPSFIPGKGWRQHAGADRRPKYFAEAFSDIIMEANARELFENTAFIDRLKAAYGSSLAEQPVKPIVVGPNKVEGY